VGRALARLNAAVPALRGLEAKARRSWAPHEPTPKQAEFLALDVLEALYGGAAGGGKSDALLMAALQYVHVPGYAALILRRTYADLALPGAIMDRAKSWLVPAGVHWDDKNKRFTFASGATITFGYLDTEADRYRYQGAELQAVLFDELTQLPERWYLYLLSRLRRLHGAPVPLRARAASNPGGVGHDWVRRRFVDGSVPGRAFVPATLADNPHLDREAYERSLALLDPTTRAQLLEGRWIRDAGGLVYAHFDEVRNVIAEAPALTHYVLGIDYGVTDATAFTVLGWREHDPSVYVVLSTKETGLSPGEAAERVKALEQSYAFDRIVGDVGGLGKGFAEEARRRFHIPVDPADKVNKRGFISLLNGELASGRIKLVEAATRELVAEWLELPWHEDRQKAAEGFEDHCSDATLYAWRAANAYMEEPAEVKPAPGSPEAYRAAEAEMFDRRVAEVKPNGGEWWEDL
jgi:hypothetical protein